MKNNLLCIVGPTGIGKTRLAMEIKRCGQTRRPASPKLRRGESVPTEKIELISVDSRQVYVGMDIGTGKDAKIFGTDLTKPDKLFNVADYVRIVKPQIEKLWLENKLPILVGGTGLYLKAIIDGIETIDVPPIEKLRKKLEKLSVLDLQKKLLSMYGYIHNDAGKEREVVGMNNSDWNNPRRLIRKIEIMNNCFVGDDLPVVPQTDRPGGLSLRINKLLIIGLTAPLSTIKQNIERRVQDRIDKGLLEEIRELVKKYGWNIVLKNTIAYKEWEDFFSGKITKEEAIKRWTLDEMQYAKRQLTWFRKDKRVVWLENDYFNQTRNNIHQRRLVTFG